MSYKAHFSMGSEAMLVNAALLLLESHQLLKTIVKQWWVLYTLGVKSIIEYFKCVITV